MTCNGPTTDAQGTCFTTLNGSCVTDGPGNYGNNERCTISVLQDSFLYVSGNFNVEGGTGCSTGGSNCFDYLTINGSYPAVPALIISAAFQGLPVFAGTTIGWVSDDSVLRDGWTLCASVRAHTIFSLSPPHVTGHYQAPTTIPPPPPRRRLSSTPPPGYCLPPFLAAPYLLMIIEFTRTFSLADNAHAYASTDCTDCTDFTYRRTNSNANSNAELCSAHSFCGADVCTHAP
jgi:hypothetical protein